MLLGFHSWNVRPQAISFPLGIACLCAIYLYRDRPRPILLGLFPLAMLLWVNSHGSYVVEFLLLGIWLADAIWRTLLERFGIGNADQRARILPPLAALGLAAAASLINPRGVGTYTYVSSLSANPMIRSMVVEWAPPAFGDQYGTIFLIGFLFCAVLLAVSPKRPDAFQLCTFVIFGALSLYSARGIVWFGITMAPIIAVHVDALAPRMTSSSPPKPDKPKPIAYLLVAVLVVIALLSSPWTKQVLPLPPIRDGLASAETPIDATTFLLENEIPGLLFHEQGFGSYLIWAAQPSYPVFVDPRIELYSSRIWFDYLDISAAKPGWERKVDGYGVSILMLSPLNQASLIEAAARSADWRQVYADDNATVFMRSESNTGS